MALFLATDTFAYISLDGKIIRVDGTDVVDRGPWAAATAYVPNDVILYQNTLYVCLAGHTNQPPTAIQDDFWSSLVKTSGSTQELTLEDVYELAQEALDLAQQALEAAWAGTQAASSVAYPALVTAWTGTATADVALAIASAGTDLAYQALQTAWSGTDLAYDALQQAWYGTQAAADIGYPALVTAWAGTAAAAAAIGLANEAMILAQAGTVPPPLSSLPDVNIPAPTVSQVLAWDGSVWIAADAPSTTSPSAFTYYLDDAPSVIAPYFTLLPQPSGLPEVVASATVDASTGPVQLDAYVSDELERTLIDAGVWEFKSYASVSPKRDAKIITEIYQRNFAGDETLLFAGTSSNISTLTPTVQLETYILAQAQFGCTLTDRLVAKYYAVTDSTPPVTVSLYLAGTAHCSHFHTPLRTAHNELAGLQGGQDDEYFHATADQNAALLGTLGHPSAANRYVTADAELQTVWAGTNEAAARAAADAALAAQISAGTQAGSAASAALQAQVTAQGTLLSSTTTTAYTALQTAWSGTAGVAQVQVTAVSGSNTANAAMALAQTLNAVISAGQQGTTVAYFGQVANSNKTDIRATFASGVLISVVGSRYNWEDFERYDLGIVGQGTGDLGLSTSWSGTGVIYTADQQLGFYGTDAYESYAIGTNATGAFAGGRRWGGAGAIAGPYLAVVAAEPFTGYGTATGIAGAYISAGTGWSAAPTLFAY